MEINLRPYQEAAVEAAVEAFTCKRKRNGIIIFLLAEVKAG